MFSGMPESFANFTISSSSALVLAVVSKAFDEAFDKAGKVFDEVGRAFGDDEGGGFGVLSGPALGSAFDCFLRFLNIASSIVCLRGWLPVCLPLQRYKKCVKCQIGKQ